MLLAAWAAIGSPALAASGGTLQSYADCAGIFVIMGITQQLDEERAPPYARDVYQKRNEFYLQGMVNLQRRAEKIPGYDEEKFKASSAQATDREQDALKASGAAYLPTFNEKVRICIGMAGLSDIPFPQQ